MAFAFEPTPEDVKALMPERLDGNPFNDDSHPSVNEVLNIISDVAIDVAATVEVPIPDKENPLTGINPNELARYAVKLGAAAEIERGFWPEQSDNSDEATYVKFRTRYQEVLDRLRTLLLTPPGTRAGTIRITSPNVVP